MPRCTETCGQDDAGHLSASFKLPSGRRGTFIRAFGSISTNQPFEEDEMQKLFAAALLSAAVFSAPAYAQTAQTAQPDRAAPAATTAGSQEKMALKGTWRASKLMGLDVYNEGNEKLGDINELILDKNGKVAAVVIGVGGFLGMGEHDIAVSMDKLKFVEEPVRTSSTATTTTRDNAAAPRDTTTGAATSTTTTARTSNANDWTPDHAVMSGTKEQLKAMPQFKYSDYN
jgi:sporulation protein YlmC with PRC-barrel domain